MNEGNKEVDSIPLVKNERTLLKDIMCKLVSISDVSGAAIIKPNGSVVSLHMNDGIEPKQYIQFMLEYISYSNQENIHDYKQGMFTQQIMDCNGHKILMSRIRADVILMLLLDKRAYLGLTMLDMEGCLREIDGVLDECCS